MTQRKKCTFLWSAAGMILSLGVLLVVLSGLGGHVFVTDAEGIPETAEAVMCSLRDGDWKTLDTLVADGRLSPPKTGEENTVESLIWNAYQQSLQWRCNDGFEILNSGAVTQQVTVSCLDISAVTGSIAESLAASSESNQDQTLMTAAVQVLQEKAPIMEQEITMTFVREESRWRLVPNKALLELLSGFTVS